MKTILSIAAGALLSIGTLCAQNNNTLVVFAEGGERFYLILNGIRQNDAAATNVKAVGLNQSTYKAKVIFEQKGIPDADKTLYMAWEGNPASNMEFVCSIKKDKKGRYKWSYVSTAPASASSPYASLQPSYPGSTGTASTNVSDNTQTSATVNTTASTNTNIGATGMNTSVGVNDNTTNTTVSTSTTTVQGTNGMNMGVNMNGAGININMNITDPVMGGTTQTTTTTTTSTSTTYTTSNTSISTSVPTVTMSTNVSAPANTTYTTQVSTTTPSVTTTSTSYQNSSYTSTPAATSASGCSYEMSSSDFASARQSIAGKSFEDSKFTVAKQILNTNCMNTAQVKEIMDQFTYEQTKLDWAKYAYKRTTDPNNYFKINDGFTYESSITELNDYISKVK